MVPTMFLFLLVSACLTTNVLSMPSGDEAKKPCPINYVCYAVDQSGSIRQFYREEQDFVIELSRDIGNRSSNASYSAFGFSTSFTTISKSTTDLEGTFIPAVESATAVFRSTRIDLGLEACFNELKNKGQPGDNKVIVVVTDGNGGNARALALRPQISNSNIDIVTVGIGSGVNRQFLENLANSPEFYVRSEFGKLLSDAIMVVDKTCQVVTTTPPVDPTTPPTITKDACTSAYDACMFTFANGGNTLREFQFSEKPDIAFTPRIISKNSSETIGVVNTNGFIPEFIEKSGAVPITTAGASPKYTPTHFKPFSIKNTFGSGIGHQTFLGNQKSFAQGKCVRVRFSSYQELIGLKPPYVKRNFNNLKESDNKCVVFVIGS